MGALINGETKCFLCNHTFNYVSELGGAEIIESPAVKAESAIATGNFLGTEGRVAELEIIVACPKCGTRNKTVSSIPAM